MKRILTKTLIVFASSSVMKAIKRKPTKELIFAKVVQSYALTEEDPFHLADIF